MEDIYHVFIYCSRAIVMYDYIRPLLVSLGNSQNISLMDLIFGKKVDSTRKFILFNYVIQTAQFAIWKSRNNFEMDKNEIHPVDIYRTVIFRNLCRHKVVMNEDKFFHIFDPLITRTEGTLKFCLKNW